MQEPRWTLDELAERVDLALAVDYHGQPSGRVRAVPDRRAIRWYTTIGLIDRPVAHRGRTALYGPRHLLQLVAVKRLQARGLPLVAIQQELAGATDGQLARVARLPEGARPTVPSGPVPAAAPDGGDPPPRGRVPDRPGATVRQRSPAPAQPPAVAPRVAGGTARRAGFWRDRPAAAFTAPATEAAPAPVQGVRLGGGATLLLEPGRELAAADLDAILDAAGPLLAVLRDRGLDGSARTPDEDPGRSPGPLADHEARPARRAENEPRREHP
jgi:DNA-binding transcriptional MerR regulator